MIESTTPALLAISVIVAFCSPFSAMISFCQGIFSFLGFQSPILQRGYIPSMVCLFNNFGCRLKGYQSTRIKASQDKKKSAQEAFDKLLGAPIVKYGRRLVNIPSQWHSMVVEARQFHKID
jgi:hypothetical protein